MTPKEKAEELALQFFKIQKCDVFKAEIVAKQCALICVEEIMKLGNFTEKGHELIPIEKQPNTVKYWQQVKTEIEKL